VEGGASSQYQMTPFVSSLHRNITPGRKTNCIIQEPVFLSAAILCVSEEPTVWPHSMLLNSLQCDHTACLWTAYSVTTQHVSERPTVWHTACLWTAYSVTTQHVSGQPTVWHTACCWTAYSVTHSMLLNSLQCDHTACRSVRSLPFRRNLTFFKTQWLLCVPPDLLPIIFCLLPAQCLRASCMGLRRNSGYFTIPHQLIGF
jgi:hypothetical protein